MKENNAKTMKENYEAINNILSQNTANLLMLDEAIKHLEEAHGIVIPILEGLAKPEIGSYYNSDLKMSEYKVELEKHILLKKKYLLDKEKIQELLDKYSPIKLLVKSIDKYDYEKISVTIELI